MIDRRENRARPLTSTVNAPVKHSPWAYVAPLLIGIYGADLHKLLINTAAVLFSSPLAWKDFASSVDVGMANVMVCISIYCVLFKLRLPHTALVPFAAQAGLAILMTIALCTHYDDISLLNYKRFIGGNMALFFSALFVCNCVWKIRVVWSVWIAAALLQSLIAIWYWQEGYLWTSIRATLIPGTGVRMGYQCAIALIYCLFANKKNKWGWLLCSLFAFGILMSGSKMALILSVLSATSLMVFVILKTKKVSAKRLIMFGICAASILQVLTMIATSEKAGFHKYLLEFDQYMGSVRSREALSDEFTALAMENPLFGSGISASYYELNNDQMQTTHSAIQATFLQLGILGLVVYLVSVLYLSYIGFQAIKNTRKNFGPTFHLTLATYAAFVMMVLKAEVTSDLPGNRELWLYSGLLVHCISSLRLTNKYHVKEMKPCAESPAVWRSNPRRVMKRN